MKRILLIPVLGMTALFTFGCSNGGTTILAEVPAGNNGQSSTLSSSGSYTLYHVTEFDVWGAPTKTDKIATVNLRENERVGFDYEVPKDKEHLPDAQSDVIAYAGSSFRKDLGPIRTLTDHYYWASPESWDAYWASRPERVLGRKAVQY